MMSLPSALALLGLAISSLLLLLLSLVGGIALLGWGTRLAIRAGGSSVVRGAWPIAFLLFPGIAQLLFSLTTPTPPRFRLLAVMVSLSLAGGVILTVALMALL
ncbi:MAG: hypothetical protein HY688_03880 [Chloroflexi bacterium]|nr:hypothetical protein [Chloroflexota bacterium]